MYRKIPSESRFPTRNPQFRYAKRIAVSPLLRFNRDAERILRYHRICCNPSGTTDTRKWGCATYHSLARYIRIVEVSGSNPLCSTIQKKSEPDPDWE